MLVSHVLLVSDTLYEYVHRDYRLISPCHVSFATRQVCLRWKISVQRHRKEQFFPQPRHLPYLIHIPCMGIHFSYLLNTLQDRFRLYQQQCGTFHLVETTRRHYPRRLMDIYAVSRVYTNVTTSNNQTINECLLVTSNLRWIYVESNRVVISRINEPMKRWNFRNLTARIRIHPQNRLLVYLQKSTTSILNRSWR